GGGWGPGRERRQARGGRRLPRPTTRPAPRRPPLPPRRRRCATCASAPVVEHQVVRVLVVFLLAPLHPDHGEVWMIAALEESLVGRPVVGVDGRDHALELGGVGHVLHSGEERVAMLGLTLAAVHGEELR